MDPNYLGAIEMVFAFGVILLIGFQQLYSVNKAKKKLRDKQSATDAKPKDDA
jgi:hypothetical protein